MIIGLATTNYSGAIQDVIYSTRQPVEFEFLEWGNDDDIKKCDLIIFAGGNDISPRLYGEPVIYSVGIDKQRDELETELFWKAIKFDKKIFGICRGHQIINALLGGKLVQDIAENLGEHHSGTHGLNILEGDSFISKTGLKIVNSLHHQGVIIPGNTLWPTTKHKGVYESTENERIISVQWHPEFLKDIKFFSLLLDWTKK